MLLKILQICRKRSVLEYLFNKVIGIYPSTLLKEKGSDISAFWWILRDIRQIPYRTPPGDCFCSTEKYFSKKKNSERYSENWKQLVKKNSGIRRKKFFIRSFSRFHDILKETIQFHWGFIYHRKLFLSVGKMTLISVNARIFVKTNNEHME